jgi:thiol:disulfide interchange protein DsbD
MPSFLRPCLATLLPAVGACAWLALWPLAPAHAAERFLEPGQAFRLSVAAAGPRVRLHWTIAPGYYLYRDRIAVVALPAGARAVEVGLPAGEPKNDPHFGLMRVFREGLTVEVAPPVGAHALEVSWQGCAEAGLCYLPQRQTVVLAAGIAGSAGAAARRRLP